MKNFINNIKIEGYVYSTGSNFNQLAEKISGENSKHPGTKFIQGDLDIAVDEDGLNVVTIHYIYVTEVYGSGKANSTYTALKRIIDNPDKHWINGGKDNAFKVSCTGVSLGVNDFIANDGTKVAALRNEGGFVSFVNDFGSEDERNTFSTDMLITKVTRIEADPEKNINEDYASVTGCVFGYGPKIIPASFVIRNEEGIKYFEDMDAAPSNPVLTKVWGKVNCKTIKVEKREESAFGEAAVQTYERKSREYLITGTSKVPYDFGDPVTLDAKAVNKMMQDRETMLAEIESRYNQRKAEKANSISFDAAKAVENAMPIPEGGFKF